MSKETRNAIVNALENAEYCALTRAEIVRVTGIARTTIYDNLVKLKRKGKVVDYPITNPKRGRPNVVFQLVKEGTNQIRISNYPQS